MPFTPARLLCLVAVVIFVLAAFSVSIGSSIVLVPLGLAFLAASFLV